MRPFILIVFLVLAACTGNPVVESTPDSLGMYSVKSVPFDRFLIKSASVLQDYSAITASPINVDNVEIDEERLEFDEKPWILTEKDRARLQRIFASSFRQVFESKRSFSAEAQDGKGTLNLEVELLEFTPNAPKDDFKSREINEKIITYNVGDITLKAIITDASTGEVIAIVEDDEEIGDDRLQINDRVTNTRETRLTFQSWLSRLNNALVKLRSS